MPYVSVPYSIYMSNIYLFICVELLIVMCVTPHGDACKQMVGSDSWQTVLIGIGALV